MCKVFLEEQQRVSVHHVKPFGLRVGWHFSTCECESRQVNTFGNIQSCVCVLQCVAQVLSE